MASAASFSRMARREEGSALVEFGLIALVFFSLLIGVVELGRLLYTWNTAVEATRWGARLAAVCDQGDSTIKDRMRLMLPQLTDANIVVAYSPDGCGVANCQSVAVSVTGLSITTMIPLVGFTVPLPSFSTSLPRESMSSAGNPVCS
jgi:Flp pilus assembly pilin Flp